MMGGVSGGDGWIEWVWFWWCYSHNILVHTGPNRSKLVVYPPRDNPDGCKECEPCAEGTYQLQNETGQSSCNPCMLFWELCTRTRCVVVVVVVVVAVVGGCNYFHLYHHCHINLIYSSMYP